MPNLRKILCSSTDLAWPGSRRTRADKPGIALTRHLVALLAALALLQGCAAVGPNVQQRVDSLLPADILLIGEQHDADAHQQIQRLVVLELAQRGQLAALALEMAQEGQSTRGLAPDASEDVVQKALQWNDAGWSWQRYGPVVMAAVRHGVPVLGANLKRDAMRSAMANTVLDAHLDPVRLEQQRSDIRSGHCMLLPESQIAPMTRIQIARDAAMAATVTAARQPGKTVVLVAGGGHVRRDLGVPTHLAAALQVQILLAVAGAHGTEERAITDMVWATPALAPKDHCAELRRQFKR
jgi:uncharacterized iron-regulated protein